MNPEKKISFGFSKTSKKPALLPNKPVEEKKVELVECLEGQSFTIKDAVEIVEEPLVIPLKDNKKNLIDRINEVRSKAKAETGQETEDTRPDSELTIDELAARELLKDAKNRLSNRPSESKVSVLPLKEDILEGEKEPTLEDYEKVPINDFGLAVLRGMGWKEGDGIGKNPVKATTSSAPELRPKGLGLGANKLVNANMPKEISCDKDGNALILKNGALVKIIAGPYKSQYGEVLGLDDEAARVIVKTALKADTLTLSEFMVVPVTKEEYARCSKIINNARYEEYKEKEEEKKTENVEKPSQACSTSAKPEPREDSGSCSHNNDRGRNGRRTDTDTSTESEPSKRVHKRKDKRRHRDKSRSPHRRHNKYRHIKKSSNGYRSSSSSDSDYDDGRKDRDRHPEEMSRKYRR